MNDHRIGPLPKPSPEQMAQKLREQIATAKQSPPMTTADDGLDAAWAEYEAGAEDEADFKRIVRQHTARTVVEAIRRIHADDTHLHSCGKCQRALASWATRTGSADTEKGA